jgi:hypothetical protein
MTRRMYDSVQWQKIPANAQMVAGYVDGAYAWPQRAWARFPHASHVRISVIPPGDPAHAGVLDVETGAASVADAPPFIRTRHRAGHRAVIYVQRSLVAEVRRACRGLSFGLWVADWTGEPHRLADMKDVVAIQWDGGVNKPYDISEVFDATWHPHHAHAAEAGAPAGAGTPPEPSAGEEPHADGALSRLGRQISRDR